MSVAAWTMTVLSDMRVVGTGSYTQKGNPRLKEINRLLANLLGVFDELKLTVNLFENAEEEHLSRWSENCELRDFHQYQYDNYIVRIATVLDVCAKFGNAVASLGIDTDKCNWYSFKTHAKIQGSNHDRLISDMAEKIGSLRNQRHTKLHQGEPGDNEFGSIVYWGSLLGLIGETPEGNPFLIEHEEEKFAQIVLDMRKLAEDISKLACAFVGSFNSYLPKEQRDKFKL